MTELNFHQLQKDNEEHYKLLLTLMLTYNKELEEHTLSCSKTTETVFELTRGMLNMQGPFDRHLELCYLGDDLIGFFYGKVDHEGHKGFIKPDYLNLEDMALENQCLRDCKHYLLLMV